MRNNRIIKDFSDMLEDVQQALSTLSLSGITGGFHFDEECAEELETIVDKINYMYNTMQGEIDVLKDSLSHSNYKSLCKTDKINKLHLEIDELNEKIGKMVIKEYDNYYKKENERLNHIILEIQALYNDFGLSDEDFINEIGTVLEKVGMTND